MFLQFFSRNLESLRFVSGGIIMCSVLCPVSRVVFYSVTDL